MTRPPHPAALLFPLMTEPELIDLAADIKENGLLEPIIEHEGMILDGRNREEACERASVPARYRVWAGEAGSPVAFVASANVHRRHLTTSQRAAIAVELLPMLQAEAKQRQATSGPGKMGSRPVVDDGKPLMPPVAQAVGGGSAELAGQLVGTSRGSVQMAKTVKELDPEAFDQIKEGDAAVKPTYDRVTGKSEKRESPARLALLDKYKKALDLLSDCQQRWADDTLYRLPPAQARRFAARTANAVEFLTKTEEALRAKNQRIVLTRQALTDR